MRPPVAFLFLALLWAGMYLPGLGAPELKGEEGRRILPAREMLRRNEYILPYSEGRPYHRKPPGMNWAIAASFASTGAQSEFTARLPSALAVLALALAAFGAGRKLLGTGGAFALGVALLFNVGMAQRGRLAEIESLYVSLCGIGMLLWAFAWGTNKSAWRVWLGCSIPFALANLVKGPVWMAFFYGVVVLTLWRGRRLKDLIHPAHILGIAIALAPMIAWGVAVKEKVKGIPVRVIRDDDGQVREINQPEDVWWQQISGRLNFENIDWGNWLALPAESFLQFLPWPLLALAAGWAARRRGQDKLTRTEESRIDWLRWGLGWGSLLTAGLFCLLPATRSRYLFPALAPVTLWAVLSLQRSFAWNRVKETVWQWVRRLTLILAPILALAGLALPFFLLRDFPWLALAMNVGAAALLFVWVIWGITEKLPERIFTALAGPFLFLSAVAATTLHPWARTVDNVRPQAARINKLTPRPGSIAAVNPGPQPFLFYLGKRCVEVTRITEYPDDTEYVLIPPREWDDPDVKGRLAWRKFTEELLRFKDERAERAREYVLVGRPEGATLPKAIQNPPEGAAK